MLRILSQDATPIESSLRPEHRRVRMKRIPREPEGVDRWKRLTIAEMDISTPRIRIKIQHNLGFANLIVERRIHLGKFRKGIRLEGSRNLHAQHTLLGVERLAAEGDREDDRGERV